jgi:protease-4
MKAKGVFIFLSVIFVVLVVLSLVITFVQNEIPLGEKVALVRVEGPIIESKTAVDELKGYRKDKSVKAVVLRVNSPGGGVVAAQEIYEEVKRTAAVKKVVVSMGALAASGGYYISAPGSVIIANPGTITGSIGVIMEVPNIKGLLDRLGVKSEVITSGRHKDLASPLRGIGKEERGILQGVMDDIHEQFIKSVAESRKMPVDKVRALADGRVFSGRQAMKLGLVDQLGDLQAAIKKAGALAGISGEPEVVTKKGKSAWLELLEGKVPAGILNRLTSADVQYMYRVY